MKNKDKPKPSELRSIKVWCGSCVAEVDVVDARFEVGSAYVCGIHDGSDLESWTCFCNRGDKTIEFTCPKCHYFSSIEVV